jgi:hypothetical protein
VPQGSGATHGQFEEYAPGLAGGSEEGSSTTEEV